MTRQNSKLILLVAVLGGLATLVILTKVRLPDDDMGRVILSIGGQAVQVEIANEPYEQVQGLSGRESLCENCGMLFVYDRPQMLTFWMKDMRFAIDIIYIREGRIAEIHEQVLPPEPGESPQVVPSREPADMVLEVIGGLASANKWEAGMSVDKR